MRATMDRIRITDVAPRDGLQNEPGTVPAADKVRLIELLAAAGVDEVEATSFVSAKWVPQLGDAEEVLSAVRRSAARPRVVSALVPNEKGFERALAFHSPDFPLKIALFTAASETFNMRNTNATIDESIERFRAFLPRAFGAGMQVRFYISCAVACPFEGKTEPAAVRRVAERLIGLVPEDRRRIEDIEIDLGDTIGVAAPGDIRALLGEFGGDAWRDLLVLHLHDTFGRAVECARTAIDLGVWSFDASVAGLGGCPYAGTPERRAPGNVSTEAMARLADDMGLVTFIDPDALADAAAFAREIVARARAGAASREGVR